MPWRKPFRRKTDPPIARAAVRPERLSTNNLRMRPLREADSGALHSLWSAPDVRQFLWSGRGLVFEQTRDIVSRSASLYEERGQGLWGAFSQTDALIGFCGYWYFHKESELELMFAVGSGYWHQGYAGEMTRALIPYGFDYLRLNEIRASVHHRNTTCKHLMVRLGFLAETGATLANEKQFFYLPRSRFLSDDQGWEAA